MTRGHIGKESGQGFYIYDENGNPTGLSDAAKKKYPPVDPE
nr:hypothetical protein [Corynebacterium sanguinis]